MSYEAKIVLDSISPAQARITTMVVTYPRFIHSEILTHRDRARNSASSRAIPFPTMCSRIESDPVVPLAWLSEQRGMQGGDEIPEALRPLARAIWLKARDDAVRHARVLHEIDKSCSNDTFKPYLPMLSVEELDALENYVQCKAWESDTFPNEDALIKVHKSLPNRIVEPWMWITVVMTATEWRNFFRLRCHPDAEQHFQKIARMMRDALEASQPVERRYHLPYVEGTPDARAVLAFAETRRGGAIDRDDRTYVDTLMRVSTARCARVSYLTHEKTSDPAKDLELFEKLYTGSGFGHWSPMEHPCEAFDACSTMSGPFRGWKQFRKRFPQERAGSTLMEVLVAIMLLMIAILPIIALIAVGTLRMAKATQLTNATVLRYSAEARLDLHPWFIQDPDQDGDLAEHATERYVYDPLGSGNTFGNVTRYGVDMPGVFESDSGNYSWLATMRKQSELSADVEIVVFYRRGYEQSQVYPAAITKGSNVVGVTGTLPIKRGGFIMDADTTRWYRVADVRDGSILLETPAIESGSSLVAPTGIVDCYPLGVVTTSKSP